MLPLIRNEELYEKLEELKKIARKLLISFDYDNISSLKSALFELEISYEKVIPYLSKGDPSNFRRHCSFMQHYLDQDDKEHCKQDIIDICTVDIPQIERESYHYELPKDSYDKELKKKINSLLNQREFDSAIRKGFVILKERMKKKFGTKEKIDGSDLVNKIFGNKGLVVGYIEEDERQALRNLLDGAYGIFRNKYGHDDVEASWQETEAVISLINWSLIRIDSINYPK